MLFVMSVISLLLSLFAGISFIDSAISYSRLSTIEITNDNIIVFALLQGVHKAAMIIAGAIFAATFILGIFGLVSSIKKGRLSILCIVLAILPLTYIFFGMIYWLKYKDYDWVMGYMIALLFLVFYIAGAVKAFKGRKKAIEKS